MRPRQFPGTFLVSQPRYIEDHLATGRNETKDETDRWNRDGCHCRRIACEPSADKSTDGSEAKLFDWQFAAGGDCHRLAECLFRLPLA
jgi:hypothetical protein